jgi:hypothetical protein
MALNDSYGSKAVLKLRLGITDTNDDPKIDSALSAASQSIEGTCGRQFNDAGVVSARVFYPDSPVMVKTHDFSTSVGLILKADYGNDGVFETTWLAANYQLEPLNGIVGGVPGFPYTRIRAINQYFPLWFGAVGSPRASLEVTAQWGWASVPASVTEACLILAEELYKLKDAPFGVMGFGGMGNVVRVRENPKVMALLSDLILEPIQAR